MNNNSSKQVLLSVIGVAILVVAVVGVSFAFFSYTTTGETPNTVQTGTIVFTATTESMTLTNVFPTTAANATTATVSVSGNTTYESGIDFSVRAVDVTNANADIVPTVTVTPETVTGVTFAAGYTDATTYNKDKVLADGVISKGTIAANTEVTGTTPILTISAYYNSAEYHISDNEKQELVDAGLLQDSYTGTIIDTTTWNALADADAAYSFKIQINATQGGSTRLQ